MLAWRRQLQTGRKRSASKLRSAMCARHTSAQPLFLFFLGVFFKHLRRHRVAALVNHESAQSPLTVELLAVVCCIALALDRFSVHSADCSTAFLLCQSMHCLFPEEYLTAIHCWQSLVLVLCAWHPSSLLHNNDLSLPLHCSTAAELIAHSAHSVRIIHIPSCIHLALMTHTCLTKPLMSPLQQTRSGAAQKCFSS